MKATAELHRANKEMGKYSPGSPLHKHWYEESERLSASVMSYYQGEIRIKSIRTVGYVNKERNLIRFTTGFKYGYRPRVMGAAVRILGFENDMINEIATDRLHKGLKQHYGADWESDFTNYGIPE